MTRFGWKKCLENTSDISSDELGGYISPKHWPYQVPTVNTSVALKPLITGFMLKYSDNNTQKYNKIRGKRQESKRTAQSL